MDYKNSAKSILKEVGAQGNVRSVTHCMTRLRFVLKDESKVDDAKVKNIPGVMGVMKKGGQYQVIMGNDVADYYKELTKIGHFAQASEDEASTSVKVSLFDRFVDVISSCMSPLIPALIGGGMIKVILILLPLLGWMSTKSDSFKVLTFFGDAAFYFIPIMLAYTAAQKFQVTPMLAVTIAGIMLHPDFTAMVAAGHKVSFFGLPITLATYSSSVIPILLMVWLMKYIEAFFDRVIPNVLKSFLKPLLVILICGTLALVVVGPIGTYAGEFLSAIILWIQSKAGFLALGIMGAFMPLIVMTGMHWAFAPIFLVASASHPDVLILPAMLAANLAQGAASVGVAVLAKNKATKSMALASGISAFLAGVTEPALYGVTLKYKKPLYAAMIAGGICGVYMGFTGLSAYAFAVPSIIAIPQFIGGSGHSNIINAIIVAVAAIVITFVLTLIFGIEEEAAPTEQTTDDMQVEGGAHDPKKIYAPITGTLVDISQVNDATFAEKMMGDGVAILPSSDEVVAPFSGTVQAVFPTKHAIGLVSDSGIELLIHIGLETVELNGKYFETFVEAGDRIEKGQLLMKADFAKIKAAGYDPITPIVVTNTANYVEVVAKEADTTVTNQDPAIYIV